MKQFIVLLAVLPLMMIFFVQFTLDQVNESKISIINDYVYTAKEEAKQAGAFTNEIQSDLKKKISASLGISENDIQISSNAVNPGSVKRMTSAAISQQEWEKKMIHYKISVPLGKMMAGTAFFGIKDEDNLYVYTIDAYTASEYLK